MRTLTTVLVVALATSGSVLGAPAGASAQRTEAWDATAPATVEVQNNRKIPVTVFIERGAFDIRVGVVGPMQTATLPLPRWIATDNTEVQIFLHPEGGTDLASDKFAVHPGSRLGVIVPVSDRGYVPESPADTMSAVLSPEDAKATTLTVENTREEAVVVYVEQGEFDLRLGSVRPMTTTTLELPEWLVNKPESIEIFLHPERGADLASTTLDLRHGAHLGLRVPPR